jgi:alpha-glucosidase (family GH31 glycosyl hydrolase)
VVLPGDSPWFSASRARWVDAGTVNVAPTQEETPLFFREGALIPLRPGIPTDVKTDLRNIDLLICAPIGSKGRNSYHYVADDGHSFDYKQGVRSETRFDVEWDGDEVRIQVEELASGFGPIQARLLLVDQFERISVNGTSVNAGQEELELSGSPFTVFVAE